MQLVKSIVRPQMVEAVQEALTQAGVSGITVSEARGYGRQQGRVAVYRGREYRVSLQPKMVIECVVPDHLVRSAVDAVLAAARTGEVGDGRIFVMPVFETYTIRTGALEEAGDPANSNGRLPRASQFRHEQSGLNCSARRQGDICDDFSKTARSSP